MQVAEQIEGIVVVWALGYLLGLVLPVVQGTWQRVRLWRAGRRPLVRARLLRDPLPRLDRPVVMLSLVGLVLGGSVSLGGQAVLAPGRILLLGVMGGLLLEELRAPRRLSTLPDVVQFLARFRAASARGHDLYGALAAAGEELPPGAVARAVAAALEKQIAHRPPAAVFGGLGKLSPYLAEWVLALQESGWNLTASLDPVLAEIQGCARAEWEQTGSRRLFFAKLRGVSALGRWLAAGSLLTALAATGRAGVAGLGEGQVLLFLALVLGAVGLYGLLRYPVTRRLALALCVVVVVLVPWLARRPVRPAAVHLPMPTRTFSPTPTLIFPTATPAWTESPVPTRTPVPVASVTPRPQVKRGIPPVLLSDRANPQKKPQLYPDVWMKPYP